MTKWAGVALAPAALLLVASPSPAAAPRTHTIVMDQMKFGPAPANLKVGDTIVWVNSDVVPHTATAKNGAFNVVLKPNAKGKTVVGKAGSIAFVCTYHPGMRGILRVQAK